MSVKRYEWMACDEHACHCDVVESNEGDMVDYEDYAVLEARCAALASENAVLKSYASDCASAVEHWSSWADLEDKVLHTPETPATDAFLAEVRAQGVEMFAQKCDLKAAQSLASDVSDNWKLLGLHASYFAAQLRKGVQS